MYSSTLQDRHLSLKNTSPDSSGIPPIISEVKKPLKEMKNSKDSGIDNLTNDVMILGREKSVKEMTKNV